MKRAAYLSIVLLISSCGFQSNKISEKAISGDLIKVADSISILMSEYHYNPAELATEEYLKLEKNVQDLAETARTKKNL